MKIVELNGKKYNVVYEKQTTNMDAVRNRYSQFEYTVATAPNNVVVLLDEIIDTTFVDGISNE